MYVDIAYSCFQFAQGGSNYGNICQKRIIQALLMMILKERDSVVWIWLYLVQHQSFTGETRSWSRGIELGPRPRMEFHFTSELTSQSSLNASFPDSHGSTHWLLISVLSPPMFFVRVFPVLSPHLSVDCGLQPGPASGSGSYWQTGWKAAARCSHLATGLASVRPLIRCLLSPTRTLGCVQSPQRYHDLGSRLQKCILAVCRGK